MQQLFAHQGGLLKTERNTLFTDRRYRILSIIILFGPVGTAGPYMVAIN
jgi:hypothetical protein